MLWVVVAEGVLSCVVLLRSDSHCHDELKNFDFLGESVCVQEVASYFDVFFQIK